MRCISGIPDCVRGQSELAYLGHLVSQDRLKPDAKKVQAVQDWPLPTSVTEVQQLTGLTDCFRQFIQGNAQLYAPLYNLTKKELPLLGSPDRARASDQLKQALINPPVLALRTQSFPMSWSVMLLEVGLVQCYCSKVGSYPIGAGKMPSADQNYVAPEQEPLAVIDTHSVQVLSWVQLQRGY